MEYTCHGIYVEATGHLVGMWFLEIELKLSGLVPSTFFLLKSLHGPVFYLVIDPCFLLK